MAEVEPSAQASSIEISDHVLISTVEQMQNSLFDSQPPCNQLVASNSGCTAPVATDPVLS